MHQYELVHESLTDALREVVAALGGPKVVAPRLFGEGHGVAAAHTKLLDCLNDGRREKLSPDQVLWLLAEGRRIGCHAAMRYIARHAGYEEPRAVEPADERAALQRDYIRAVQSLERLVVRMGEIDKPALRVAS